jgi:hypothetical protein
MVTALNVEAWIAGDFGRFSPIDSHVLRLDCVQPGDGKASLFRFYTETNCYTINVIERDDGGYLGCTAAARKPRAGEDWTRGRDLADGPLTIETWRRILADIVSYEIVRVHHKSEAQQVVKTGRFDVEIQGPA